MSRILLVNPHETSQDGFSNPPLGLLYIGGTLLKHGFEVRVVDGCLEGKEAIRKAIIEFRPEMVGVTCLTPGRKKALEIAKMAKDIDPTIKVIMGGAHPTIMYKQIMENYPFVDYIALGEGEQICLEVAQGKLLSEIKGLVYRDSGKIVKNPPGKYSKNLDDIPFPAWQLVNFKRYPTRGEGIVNGIDLSKVPRVSVIFSRGCIGHCDFCSTWWIWQGWRHRSAKNMVDEIEILYKEHGIRHFCFADDAMTINRQVTIELCNEILSRELKIAFLATTRTDCVDEFVLQKLKQAGCYEISFGIETGSSDLLKKMCKENDVETAEKAIKLSKKVGLRVTALLIVGNIGETEQTIKKTINFLRKTQPDEIGCVGGLWVLPGTKVYQECKRKGFISDDFWLSDEPYKVYTREHSLKQLARFQNRVNNYDLKRRYKNIKKGIQKKLIRVVKRTWNLIFK